MSNKPVLTNPPPPPSRADSANFDVRGDAFLGWLPTAWGDLSAVINFADGVLSSVSNLASGASTSATTSTEQASIARTKATEAAESAASALANKNAAATSAANAAASAAESVAKSAEAAASAASIGSWGATLTGVPLQVFYGAQPVVLDGTKVSDLVQDGENVGVVYHGVIDGVFSSLVSTLTSIAPISMVVESGSARVVGGAGIESVYIGAGTRVECNTLSGGVDRVYFSGNWADYTKRKVLTRLYLERDVGGFRELVKIASGDRIIFKDGSVATADAISAVGTNPSVAISEISTFDSGDTTPASPPSNIPRVSGPVPSNWLCADGRPFNRADWPGLSAALAVSSRYAGDGVTTFTVPAFDPQDKTLMPHSNAAGVFAYIKGF